jgi:hypothetical protein
MMIVKGGTGCESGQLPPPELMAAIGQMSQKCMEEGLMLSTGGLMPTSHGALVSAENGRVTVTDGPFSEGREVIGGFAIFNLESKEQALKMARDFMQLHVDILGSSYQGVCEVRQMMDCPPSPAAESRAEEREFVHT